MDLSKQYDVLVEAIIRPPRVEYTIEDMGSPNIRLGNRTFRREDFELVNGRGLKLQCSLFAPVVRPKKLPCVIYCHGNAGCRLDAAEALRALLPMNVMVATLDFAGCGISEGEYISLGFYEKEDVNVLVNHLRDREMVTRIALWGRSMGAVTAIQCAQADPSLACIVADSAFSNLHTLAVELATNSDFNIPGIMLKIAFSLVRKSVKKRAKFDIKKLDIVKFAQEAFVPALFGHGDEDDFIASSHTIALQAAYAGDSNKVIFGGDHNSPRPPFFLSSVTIFFRNHLFVASDFGEDNPLPNKMSTEEYFSAVGGGDAMRIFVPEQPRHFRSGEAATTTLYDTSDSDDYPAVMGGRGGAMGGGGGGRDVTEEDLIQQAIALSLQETSGSNGDHHQSSAKPRVGNTSGCVARGASPAAHAFANDDDDDGDMDPDLAAALVLSAAEAKAAGIEIPSDLKNGNSVNNDRTSPAQGGGKPSPTLTSPRGESKKDSKEIKDKEKKKKDKKRKSISGLPSSPENSDTSLSLDLVGSPASDDGSSMGSKPDLSPKKKDKKHKDKSSSSSSSKASAKGPHPFTKANTIQSIDTHTVILEDSEEGSADEHLRAALINSSSTPPRTKKKGSKK
jgi:alpha/beta superfamily hydrolase